LDHIVCIIGIIHQMPQISAILYEICLMNQRQLFLNHVGQTSDAPLALEIVRAQGCTMWDVHGKAYIDLIAGISVCNVGHCHPEVVQAVQQQAATYMHIMVYGELVESPQVQYAKKLTDHLPSNLNAVFYTGSGSEATEGAMKLAKRYTGRTQIVSFKNSYHGSTQGALSIMGSEYWKQAFRPLLPGIVQLNYNSFEDLALITEETACVVAETIQAEMGVNAPTMAGWLRWLNAVKKPAHYWYWMRFNVALDATAASGPLNSLMWCPMFCCWARPWVVACH
jgi:acetylornithine/N-succinyldiaminopimelate aminotransferase